MTRWALDGKTQNAGVGGSLAMGLTQPACGTCGGENPSAPLESRYPLPNPVVNTPLAQGFLDLNQSLNTMLFDNTPHDGRPGVLVLGAGPTSEANLKASIMHELQIASILKDTAGVSGKDIYVGFVRELSSEPSPNRSNDGVVDSPSAFKDEVLLAFCQEFNNTTLALQKAQANIANDPNLQRIGQINMSFTMSPKIGADVLFERLEYTDPETGKPAFARLRRAVYGLSPSSNESTRYQKALDHVQAMVSNSPEIQNARERYNDEVRVLKRQGVRCIVATGNENTGNHGADVSDGQAFNMFCTPDTINVAGATTEGNVAAFSSRSGKHNDTTPTVMALGQDVPVVSSLDTLDGDKNGSIDGTSFAAPQVAGLLSHLNRYKNLSVEAEDAWLGEFQKRKIIMDTSAPNSAEGLGFFNPKGFDVAA